MSRDVDPWWEQAACQGTDTEFFYPPTGRMDLQRLAQRVCADCPVKTECLNDALDHESQVGNQPWGIRGGMTETDRADLIARTRRRVQPRHPNQYKTESQAEFVEDCETLIQSGVTDGHEAAQRLGRSVDAINQMCVRAGRRDLIGRLGIGTARSQIRRAKRKATYAARRAEQLAELELLAGRGLTGQQVVDMVGITADAIYTVLIKENRTDLASALGVDRLRADAQKQRRADAKARGAA